MLYPQVLIAHGLAMGLCPDQGLIGQSIQANGSLMRGFVPGAGSQTLAVRYVLAPDIVCLGGQALKKVPHPGFVHLEQGFQEMWGLNGIMTVCFHRLQGLLQALFDFVGEFVAVHANQLSNPLP
jgi:hypothetical protein